MQIQRYSPSFKAQWDAFISTSRNGTFLFRRDFMDYHADRFRDHSLIFSDEKGWVAVLPANEVRTEDTDGAEAVFHSHQGLTYGGFVLAPRVGTGCLMALFDMTRSYLHDAGFKLWRYKQVPYIYHRQPAEDDEYALWRIGAQLSVCNIATAIDLRSPLQAPMEERRGRGKRRAARLGYGVRRLTNPDELGRYWPVIEENLRSCHDTRPVHSCQEMQLLMRRFPENIKVWVADARPAAPERHDGEDRHDMQPLQGCGATESGIIVVFEADAVAHSQYPHATEQGKKDGVMDLLFLHVLEEYKKERPSLRYFDFGISNEQGGRFLNEGLQTQKEGFGAHGVAYRQWSIPV